jgi:rhodanese-related sulfurtransferase
MVDVREANEFASGHIPSAVNEPLSSISQTTLPKTAPLFLYCLRGTRSRRTARILRRMGYTVKSIGGIGRYKGELKR